jgi:hypothetical protein
MNLPDITTPDGRRAWAFAAIVGGAMVFSLFIWVALWLLRNHEGFVFYLAIAAHVQVFVGMTALGFAMGRRLQASISKDGVTIDDKGDHE